MIKLITGLESAVASYLFELLYIAEVFIMVILIIVLKALGVYFVVTYNA